MKNHETLEFLMKVPLSEQDWRAFMNTMESVQDLVNLENLDRNNMTPVKIRRRIENKVRYSVEYLVASDNLTRAKIMYEKYPKERNKVVERLKEYMKGIPEVEKIVLGWYDDSTLLAKDQEY